MMPLARYLLYLLIRDKSQAQLSKIREAVRLFAEYSVANNPGCDFGRGTTGSVQKVKHWEHFQNFRSAVVFGTFGADGLDPSGLCWEAKGTSKADQTIEILTKFFSWLDNLDGGDRAARFNPVVEGAAYEHLLAAAAYEHARSRALLGHTWASAQEKEVEVRTLQGASPRRQPTSEPKRISRIQFERLLTNGFDIGSENGLRDALIAILMNKGGLRLSEALHVWVIDINDDPASPRSALVRVHHPSQAKSDLQHRSRTFKSRSDYLRAVSGLKDRSSLVKRDAQHLGWKSRFTVLEIYWAEPWWGKVFLGMWRRYLRMTAARRSDSSICVD